MTTSYLSTMYTTRPTKAEVAVAVLVLIGVTLAMVAVWAGVGHALLEVAHLACAECVDPSHAMGTAAAAVGTAGAAAAAGGLLGGAPPQRPAREWRDPSFYPQEWRDPGTRHDADDEGSDVTPANMPPRRASRLLKFSRQLQHWAEQWVGKDEVHTVPAGGKG